VKKFLVMVSKNDIGL